MTVWYRPPREQVPPVLSEPPASGKDATAAGCARLTPPFPHPRSATQLAREVSLEQLGGYFSGVSDQTQKENQLLDYLHPALASVDATSLSGLGYGVTTPHAVAGRKARSGFPRPRGLCREGARGPGSARTLEVQSRRDPSSPRPATPPRHLGSCCGRAPTGRESVASGGCVIATPITALPPPAEESRRARESSVPHVWGSRARVRVSRSRHPWVRMQKKRTVQVTESRRSRES